MALINGTAGPDSLLGTETSDTINGLAGDDEIDGLGGNDTLNGGDGADIIHDDAGTDALHGDAGEDLLIAWGSDFLGRSSGTGDIFDGGAGFDVIGFITDVGVTVTLGATGTADGASIGAKGIISIEGAIGGRGDDTITGDAGDNLIQGYDGSDTLNGGGGIDIVAWDLTEDNLVIDIAAGTAIGGPWTDTFTGFEIVVAGVGNDVITGDASDNIVDGLSGDDRMHGGDGADLLAGNVHNDELHGDAGDDALFGEDGNDVLLGGAGDDELDGGAGFDWASYDTASGGVVVSLAVAGAQNTGGAGVDTLAGFEGLIGSPFADTLIGNAANNQLEGGFGNDVLHGGAGSDQMDGGAGLDWASYTSAGAAVTVSLMAPGAQDTGGAGLDILTRIENLAGSPFSDTLVGNAGANTLTGGNGNDVLHGRGGNDRLVGNTGADWASYRHASAGVTVSLAISGPQDTGGDGVDTLVEIEKLAGSLFNDVLTGDAGVNHLVGSDGDDVLDGGAGDDMLVGNTGLDWASYSSAAAGVTVSLAAAGAQDTGGAGVDTLVEIENLSGTAFNDTLTGDAGANSLSGGDGGDVLLGGAGDDVITGGAGADWASYTSAGAGVTVSLAITGPQDTGGAGMDTLAEIENLAGSIFADTLTGDAGDNRLTGGNGNDVLQGGAGDDRLVGNTGADWASYRNASAGVTVSLAIAGPQDTVGAGVDTLVDIEKLSGSLFDDALVGDAGANTLVGGNGDDVLQGGGGRDTLTGNSGADRIVYQDVSDSTDAARDLITGFETGVDLIDLSALAPTSVSLTFDGGVTTLTATMAGGDLVVDIQGVVTESDLILGEGGSGPVATDLPDLDGGWSHAAARVGDEWSAA